MKLYRNCTEFVIYFFVSKKYFKIKNKLKTQMIQENVGLSAPNAVMAVLTKWLSESLLPLPLPNEPELKI